MREVELKDKGEEKKKESPLFTVSSSSTSYRNNTMVPYSQYKAYASVIGVK